MTVLRLTEGMNCNETGVSVLREHFERAAGGINLTKNYQVEDIQQDTTVCKYLFTAKLLYMFWASIAPIIRST